MATNTTGQKTPKAAPFAITKASPDSPIYKRGLMIGGKHMTRSSRNTAPATPSDESQVVEQLKQRYGDSEGYGIELCRCAKGVDDRKCKVELHFAGDGG